MTTQTPILERRSLLTGAAALLGLAHAPKTLAQSDLASLNVIDRDTGAVLPAWRHQGRLFVAGDTGKRYGLRLGNRSNGRLLLVLSVDGVNVITGETAAYGQRGYVLGPYESRDVNGWRKSETEIAAFTFSALGNSYAARTGRPGEVGVIGMAVFQEKAPAVVPVGAGAAIPSPPAYAPPPPRLALSVPAIKAPAAPAPDIAPPPPLPLPPVEKPAQAPSAPTNAPSQVVVTATRQSSTVNRVALAPSAIVGALPAPAMPAEKLGTAHGALEPSILHVVSFVRSTPAPVSLMQIEYDSRANLVARGVIPPPPPEPRRPRPFPGAGYVPDPPAN